MTVYYKAAEELGELLLSLCYLPAAGRLTLTVIKARNLKAMDFTGQAGEQCQQVTIMTSDNILVM